MEGITVSRMCSAAVWLLLLSLLVKAAIPAGWMPSAEKAFAVTVCAGADTHVVWLDKNGKTHKEDPAKEKSSHHDPCAFSGLAMDMDRSGDPADVDVPMVETKNSDLIQRSVGVGRGLAAPPPPSTGPPVLI